MGSVTPCEKWPAEVQSLALRRRQGVPILTKTA
jgi:hypothetical protein